MFNHDCLCIFSKRLYFNILIGNLDVVYNYSTNRILIALQDRPYSFAEYMIENEFFYECKVVRLI